ncbi:wiskott-Aldrich syndrome protein homolog 1-like [Aquila chrysaetos chrysaetos]|uniref:wiskott-Aldrich syndrome protein homolog 1-like n=1 Tax=Aquila chrysaetos chrysaetos TaxID=223781 RepID=UPI001177161D|nr:wiskott-Aldrich syndrome protein homolog 1-like [Aquila chrysaetos chrysaetos]
MLPGPGYRCPPFPPGGNPPRPDRRRGRGGRTERSFPEVQVPAAAASPAARRQPRSGGGGRDARPRSRRSFAGGAPSFPGPVSRPPPLDLSPGIEQGGARPCSLLPGPPLPPASAGVWGALPSSLPPSFLPSLPPSLPLSLSLLQPEFVFLLFSIPGGKHDITDTSKASRNTGKVFEDSSGSQACC